MTNSNSDIVYKKLPDDDPEKRKPSIELAKDKLDWYPKVERKQGLRKTIDYFNKILDIDL